MTGGRPLRRIVKSRGEGPLVHSLLACGHWEWTSVEERARGEVGCRACLAGKPAIVTDDEDESRT